MLNKVERYLKIMKVAKDEKELITLSETSVQLRQHWLESALYITFPFWSILLIFLGMKYLGVKTVKEASGALLFIGAVGFLISVKPIFTMRNIPFLVRLILAGSYYFFAGTIMLFMYVWPLAG